jgi:hypothetical protein
VDEEEFDSLMQSSSFTAREATLLDAKLRRRSMLALALCGRTVDDLKRQLTAPHPEIPVGVEIADVRELHLHLQSIPFETLKNRLRDLAIPSGTVYIGTELFTVWEARCEVVRRALEYLENR